jgi:hypothetical protein
MATYIQIGSTITVGSGGAANMEFTSIPATYTDLLVKISTRDTTTGVNWGNLQIQFNNSGGTAYSARLLYGNGSAALSASQTSQANVSFLYSTSADATASTFSNGEVYIPNYASSNNKSFSADVVTETNGTTALAGMVAGLWANTAAITSIKLTPASGSLAQHSTATLYGISKS